MFRLPALAAALLIGGCEAPAGEPIGQGRLGITNGTDDDGDQAVVGLVGDGGIYCTGTVIAPRVVLTAAHCLVATTVTEVVVGAAQSSGEAVPAVHAHLHPGFDSLLLTDDVGLVLLGEPAAVAPLPRLAAVFDASFTGRTVRLVGFGLTGSTDTAPVRKREGTATIGSFTDTGIEILPGPSLTCGGDSGGPAFLTIDATEYLAGITSAGDADCMQFTRSMRADAYRAFIDEFIAATDEGAAGLGERCYYPEHCATGDCFFPPDAPRIGYCAGACAGDDDCAGGMTCAGDQCRYPEPSPGALGSTCESYTECDSLLCARAEAGGAGSCSVACIPEAPSCPSGFECLQDADQEALHACFPEDTSGGCSTAPGGGGVLAYLGLIAVLLRSRRSCAAGCAAARRWRRRGRRGSRRASSRRWRRCRSG